MIFSADPVIGIPSVTSAETIWPVPTPSIGFAIKIILIGFSLKGHSGLN